MISPSQKRLNREKKTILAMIELYCRENHPGLAGLCLECAGLYDYALQRIERCPFKAAKPTCANCTVHCYKPALREQIRKVMRYAGPRMLFRHPLLATLHLIDGALVKTPSKRPVKSRQSKS